MAFKDFASIQYVKTIETGERIRMGGFKPSAGLELTEVRVLMYINGSSNLSGSESAMMTIYSDQTTTTGKELVVSNASLINSSTIDNLGSTNWVGFFKFSFPTFNLNPNTTYYPAIELSNYADAGDSFYVGFAYDFPAPVYSNLSSGDTNVFFDHPIGMQVFGNTELDI